MLIKDSFNHVVIPFLALGIKDLTAIDRRDFNGSIKTLISKEKYDIVIIAYYTDCIPSNNSDYMFFNFE